MPNTIMTIVWGVILAVVWLLIVWIIIRSAILSALRQARHENRIEKLAPLEAKWLYGDAQNSASRMASKR